MGAAGCAGGGVYGIPRVRLLACGDHGADRDCATARVRKAYVVSAPVAGRLERLPLEVGDPVMAGRTIAARLRPIAATPLDPRSRAQAAAAIAAARAALASAQAQQARLTADAVRTTGELARLRALQKGFIAQQDLDNAQAAADAAREAVRAADADVDARRADLASAESAFTNPQALGHEVISVYSPASGVVTHLLQQSERSVAAGEPLIEIGDTEGLEAQIEFLSQDAVRIRPGQRAEIYNWGGPRPIAAEVRLVEPQGFTKISALGVEEQRALVMLQFTGGPERYAGIAPGYRVWGRVFLREAPDAVLVSTGALVRSKGDWAVFRSEGGRAHLRRVHVGILTDRDAEILEGLSPGDAVVDYPSDQVVDHVKIVGNSGT